MATAAIRIDQPGHPTQVVGRDDRSRDDLQLGIVRLRNADDTGVRSWRWSLLDRPEGSAAFLSNPVSAAPEFTADLPGTYFVQLIINEGLAGQVSKRCAIVRDSEGLRIPASGEQDEANYDVDGEPNAKGWHPDLSRFLEAIRATRFLDWKESVRAATTGPGTLATSFEAGDTIDGVVLVAGDRLLVKDQAAPAENGIYVVAASGAPTRSTDADDDADVTTGMAAFVEEGTTNAGVIWALATANPIDVGVTGLTFITLGAVTDHGALSGLADDDHPQYLLVSGARAMTGALDMGGQQVTNVGNVDGVDVSAHGSRHAAAGADALQLSTNNRILGRATAGAGAVEELTAAQVSTMVGSSIDHGVLAGLADDDHTQYVLANGSRAMALLTVTGDESCGGRLSIGGATAIAGEAIRGIASNGAFLVYNVDTDVTNKVGRWGVRPYVVAQSPFYGVLHSAQTAINAVQLGGGTSQGQAATQIDFFTATAVNTLTGTLRWRVDSAGHMTVGADATYDIGTTTSRPRVVYADQVDVGDGSGSPTVFVNKTATGTAYVQYRQAVGADTDSDVRVGIDEGEQFQIQRRIGGSFDTRLYLNSTLGWVTYAPVHCNNNGNEEAGAAAADDLTVGDPNSGDGGLTIWIGAGAGTIDFGVAGSTRPSWIEVDTDTFTLGLEEASALTINHSALRPSIDNFMDLGANGGRFQYLFCGALAPEVQASLDNQTFALADEGFVRSAPSTGDVTLTIPASTSANRGKTYLIEVVNTTNDTFVDASGSDTVNGSATGNLATQGAGLYILVVLGDGDSRVFGPITRPTFT